MAIFKKKEADAYNELDAKKNASNVSDGMLRFNRVSPFANAMYSALFIFIAAICVLPEPWTEQNHFLNSSMKVVRGRVEEAYKENMAYAYTTEGKSIINKMNLASL